MSFGYFVCKDGSPPNPSFSAQDYICNQKQKQKKKKRRKITWRRGKTLYEAALFFFFLNPLVNLDSLPLFSTSSVKLRLQYFVSLFTNLAWTSATVKEENLHLQKLGRSSLYTS